MKDASEKKRLTLEDPVPKEVLAEFQGIREAHLELADRNLMLDREKVRVLAAANKLDLQEKRLFEAILVDRGLSPDTLVELDAHTGKLTLRKSADAKPAPEPEA
jgi:hypothetical protein